MRGLRRSRVMKIALEAQCCSMHFIQMCLLCLPSTHRKSRADTLNASTLDWHLEASEAGC